MSKSIKNREPIALREKALSGGRKSLYLDYYVEATRGHKYEFLKLYLIPERTKDDKIQNANTMQVAKAMQAQRLLERANGKAGISNTNRGKILLSDYIQHYIKVKGNVWKSNANADGVHATEKRLQDYKSTEIPVSAIDKDYCIGFIQYLSKTKLAERTKHNYWQVFCAILSQAVRDDVIQTNPADKVGADERKPIQREGKTRAYLTIDEVQKLADTPCYSDMVKRAFMFACFCGLRISDIRLLKWGDIQTSNGKTYIHKRLHKTGKLLYLPISENAKLWIPERDTQAKEDAPVFVLPKDSAVLNYHVKRWAKSAEIKKDMCFHVSRHTFATTLLTMGADLYTTSKLLGHTKITTTQIYAEIVSKKKDEAIAMLDNISL